MLFYSIYIFTFLYVGLHCHYIVVFVMYYACFVVAFVKRNVAVRRGFSHSVYTQQVSTKSHMHVEKQCIGFLDNRPVPVHTSPMVSVSLAGK